MKPLQLLSIAATSICIFLLAFALNYEDPLMAQYKQCLEKCMQVENTASKENILMRYPQLRMALNCITKAKQLKSEINTLTGGPAPDINKDQALELKEMRQQFNDLRAEAKNRLDQIQFGKKHLAGSI